MERQEHGPGLHVQRLSAPIGAEVRGFNAGMLNAPALGPALHRGLLTHQLLLLRGLDLTPERLRRLAGHLGPLRPVPDRRQAVPGMPQIQRLSNLTAAGTPSGIHPDPYSLQWHTDGAATAIPSRFTLLYAETIPNHGGETHFASMVDACAALDPNLRKTLIDRQAIHDIDLSRHCRPGSRPMAAGGLGRWSRLARRLRVATRMLSPTTTRHPLICLHEETGRAFLYIGDSAWRVTGYSWPGSARLIDELNRFATSNPVWIYQHHWNVGDLLIWDNHGLLHRGSHYEGSQARVMLRAVVNGGRRRLQPAPA